MCKCGFTTNPEGKCNGTHNFVKKVRGKIADDVWQKHLDSHEPNICNCEELVKWVREEK